MDIEITSESKKTKTQFQLKLLDINESRIEVPDVKMTSNTILPSTDFQRLCRDMSNIGTEIENINAANSPAVVPPRTRTNAKTEIVVNDPITNGKIITKSYNDELEPNN